MGNLSVSELAEDWYRELQPIRSGEPSHNKLFEMLYNAYRQRNGISEEFSDLTNYHETCLKLYNWYTDRYSTKLNMLKGKKGQDRTVGPNDETYTFNRLYCDSRQFQNYLETDLPMSGSQDLLAFVLHTAVAFLVPLKELDKVLQCLGFHPLHVRNIHHISIAYVLLTIGSRSMDVDFNPFTEVKSLYFKALKILDEPDVEINGSYSYLNQETGKIRDTLFLQGGLAEQKFEVLIAQNRTNINMRHSLILSDFHKLSAIFIYLFDSSAAPKSFKYPEESYSFYCFVVQFCKTKLTRKKFRENLTSMIDMNQKHPTRSVLILLWLYAYCFSFLPNIIIEGRVYRNIVKQLKKVNKQWAEEVCDYYQDGAFDVYGFITNRIGRMVPQIFRGSDFLTFINDKLLSRYGWGVLNDRLPFDHYIYSLQHLTFQLDCDGCCINGYYDNKDRLDGLIRNVDNVPFPLVAITQIFENLTQLHIQKAARNKYVKLPSCPLKCDLYEQL